MGIVIKNPGIFTTVQDRGRYGHQRYGVPVSGAMDQHSYAVANTLVGSENAAVLEATIMGPEIEFHEENVFAVTGADLGPCLNGRPVPNCRAVTARKGDVLSFTGRKTGCRAYIAFAGGLDIPEVMGSRSTYEKAKLGGFCGRRLKAGDEIGFLSPDTSMAGCHLEQETYESGTHRIRVIPGPQDDCFTDQGKRTFLSSEYTVLPQSDRMGYRFDGPVIEHVKDGNIITDGISFGAIQVPSDGKPIIMMADRQTTGGYTKIANVISADLPVLAQCMPGEKVVFEQVSVAHAQELYLEELAYLKRIKEDLNRQAMERAAKKGKKVWYYHIHINGKDYDAKVEENADDCED